MTKREKEILELIEVNPLISQKELANKLGITRSSAAVHIANLMKKGYILGKGYVIYKHEYVSILGGANIDIQGFSKKKFIYEDSNPGDVKISLGGVGRNIGENLSKLGVETKLLTAVGNDLYGKKILNDAKQYGLDLSYSLILDDESTSNYMCILDEKGSMVAAISNMDIFDKVTPDFIREKRKVISNSRLCVIDTNLPEDVIRHTVTNIDDVDYFLDTVSTTKAMKIKDIIGYFHTIKPNKLEAEVLSGIEINNVRDMRKAANYFLSKGVKRVFITLGENGIYYNDGEKEEKIKSPKIEPINVTGAGDAFVAGLAYCYMEDEEIEYAARFSMAASILAMKNHKTINPNMSANNVLNIMKETGLC
ncbi:PfkB family carbohydrate kinase [Clostridium sediminicola]|uniref:PfkB family carbohydrate kinase n=1 Tax=Clostridium sediminicola TaxID=3114879 RepID=UPI0031F1F8E8